jgi:GNAT superfamily N-acetyltransferase
MKIEGFDPGTEPGKVRTFYEMYAAGIPIDDPDGPPWTQTLYSAWVQRGWSGERRKTALAVADDGTRLGAYLIELPERRNKHLGHLTILVPPERRRQGIGRELLTAAVRCAAQESLTTLTTDVRCGTPGAAFAAAIGARAGLIDIRRVLDLTTIPDGHLASLRRQAEAASAGYSLVSWDGPVPEEYLMGVATVSIALNDAPHNPDREARRPDPEQIRKTERFHAQVGTRRYSVAARHDQTGEIAGITQVAVDRDDPVWGYQLITAVTGAHRGHRLGLLIKVAMLEMLPTVEPTLRSIVTDNAAANKHMIAINADLGFKVLDHWQSWDLDVTPPLP